MDEEKIIRERLDIYGTYFVLFQFFNIDMDIDQESKECEFNELLFIHFPWTYLNDWVNLIKYETVFKEYNINVKFKHHET